MLRLPYVLLLALALAACDPAAPVDPDPPDPPETPTGPFTLAFARVPVGGEAGPGDYRDVSLTDDGHIAVVRGGGLVVSPDGGANWLTCTPPGVAAVSVAFRPDGARLFVGSYVGQYAILSGDCGTVQESGELNSPTGEAFAYTANEVVWYEDTPGQYDVVLAMGTPNRQDGGLIYGEPDAAIRTWSRVVPNYNPGSPVAPPSAFQSVGITEDDAFFSGFYQSYAGLGGQPRLMMVSASMWPDWIDKAMPAGPSTLVPVSISPADRYGDPVLYLFRNDSQSPAIHWLYAETTLENWRPVTMEGVPSEATIYRARFDAAGRVWLATSRGLYRSDRAVNDRSE